MKKTTRFNPHSSGEMIIPLMDQEQAAAYLGISPGTLANMRSKGNGPKYTKISNLVRYTKAALDKYIDENTFDPAA